MKKFIKTKDGSIYKKIEDAEILRMPFNKNKKADIKEGERVFIGFEHLSDNFKDEIYKAKLAIEGEARNLNYSFDGIKDILVWLSTKIREEKKLEHDWRVKKLSPIANKIQEIYKNKRAELTKLMKEGEKLKKSLNNMKIYVRPDNSISKVIGIKDFLDYVDMPKKLASLNKEVVKLSDKLGKEARMA